MTNNAQHLLANGTNPNAKSFDDWTPVHVPAESGHRATLRVS